MRRSRCLLANNDNTGKLVCGFCLRPKRKFVENIFLRLYSFLRKVFMNVDVVLIVVSVVLILVGTAGTVVPVLPGVPFVWAGLLAAFFSEYSEISVVVLVVTGIASVVVSIADNVFPAVMTKKSGGSKYGTAGSVVGLIAGFFMGPLGIILGPFAGAFVGEMIFDSSDMKRVLNAAFGSFKGFLFGTGLKLLTCLIFIWIFIFSLNFD